MHDGYEPDTVAEESLATWGATVQISGVDVLLPVHVSVVEWELRERNGRWVGLGRCRLLYLRRVSESGRLH